MKGRKTDIAAGFAVKTAITVLLLFIGHLQVSAAEPAVFGPVRYERNTAKPVTETASFTAPAGTGYVLTVVNGNEQGSQRVSAATVLINGDAALVPSDFNQQTAWLGRAVSLNQTNQLSITLDGNPGVLSRWSSPVPQNRLPP